ncbi:MAG: hypothetical protein H6838_12150 [Planctomycetes bacterium]|nr:hypothetical protein [Planctomycetota bacterium]
MLRPTLFLVILAAAASAQSPSGRHFLRDSRMPTTAAAAPVVEAAATRRVVSPLPKMRSGRAWPRFHFGRLPAARSATSATRIEEAAVTRPVVRRGFWGVRR